ncbi:MAG: DUF4436 domain-containing protein [Muribaculaceae bacterium]|nr:DUF4436 domain-containing protein [Muribaculaceae bacterium]
MEKFIRQCVIIALIALALMMLGDIPPDALPMGAWIAQLIGFKTLGVLAFGLAVQINKEWRVYGYKE